MSNSTCAQCNSQTDGRKYCSEKCRNRYNYLKRKNRSRCSHCGEPMAPVSKTSAEKPMHRSCRNELGGVKSTCVECGRKAIARNLCNTHYSQKFQGAVAKVSSPCRVCGEPVSHLPTSEFPCHRNCKGLVPEWKRKGLPGPAEKRARRIIAKAAAGTHGGGRVWTVGNCSWCGDHFTSPNAKFCSRNCAKYSRDANNPHKFSISPVRRAALYERDNWTCQLCFEPVDPTLHYLDAWAATLDHVIPQSWMLVPDHSESNLQLAHRMCNSLKGDRVEMEVV